MRSQPQKRGRPPVADRRLHIQRLHDELTALEPATRAAGGRGLGAEAWNLVRMVWHVGCAAGTPMAEPRQRHRPEETVLRQVVSEHLEEFLRDAREQRGSLLPRFVERAFRAYLLGGLPSAGFARLVCTACGHEAVLAFRLGFRPFRRPIVAAPGPSGRSRRGGRGPFASYRDYGADPERRAAGARAGRFSTRRRYTCPPYWGLLRLTLLHGRQKTMTGTGTKSPGLVRRRVTSADRAGLVR